MPHVAARYRLGEHFFVGLRQLHAVFRDVFVKAIEIALGHGVEALLVGDVRRNHAHLVSPFFQ